MSMTTQSKQILGVCAALGLMAGAAFIMHDYQTYEPAPDGWERVETDNGVVHYIQEGERMYLNFIETDGERFSHRYEFNCEAETLTPHAPDGTAFASVALIDMAPDTIGRRVYEIVCGKGVKQ